MRLYKAHRYVQPKDNKYCGLYNIANIFNMDLDFLNPYKEEGIGTKDLEYIIKQIGFPKAYIAVMNNVIKPHFVPEDTLRFIVESVQQWVKEDKLAVLPTVIKLKSGRVHWITILLGKEKIIISDPRQEHMLSVTIEELIKGVVIEQLSVILNFKGFRKHSLFSIDK